MTNDPAWLTRLEKAKGTVSMSDFAAGEIAAEVRRLQLIERAAAHYRFAGSLDSLKFLEVRGWQHDANGVLWYAPDGYPVDSPKSPIVALAVELELALGLHK